MGKPGSSELEGDLSIKKLLSGRPIICWSMADWDGLIAQLESAAVPTSQSSDTPVVVESNQSYEFGDLLESSVQALK